MGFSQLQENLRIRRAVIGYRNDGLQCLQRRTASQCAQTNAKQQGQAQERATQDQIGNFKKAFSVGPEAKEYLVKY